MEETTNTKGWVIGILVVIVVVLGGYMLFKGPSKTVVVNQEPTTTGNGTENGNGTVATTTPTVVVNKAETVIGKSVEGRDVTAYHYGTGNDEVLFIGGIHGGYEWNTTLLAYKLMDYLKTNRDAVPSNLKVTVIPVLNPDGLVKVVGTASGNFKYADVSPSVAVQISGRFNGNNVDLGRNFDCNWQTTGMWQNRKVSGGSAVFSEPESAAIKNYVETKNLKAVIVYYSAGDGAYSSACGAGVLPETGALTSLYAISAGYGSHAKFDAYPTTGDIVNWLAKIKIPAISVLLNNHTDIDWDQNLPGVKAVLAHYAK